jgi:hypothetical protein
VRTVLGVTFKFAGGMVPDQKGDLHVCDRLAPGIDFIEYPSNSVTKKLGSGCQRPFHATASYALNQIYVANFGAAEVKNNCNSQRQVRGSAERKRRIIVAGGPG